MIFEQTMPETSWQQLQQYRNKFSALASQSIIDSTDERDQLESQITAFSYNQFIDCIFGGYYIKKDKDYYFNFYDNCLLAEFFIAASQTFFNGDLDYLAINMIDNLILNYCRDNQHSLLSGSFDKNNFPFIINKEVLNKQLNKEELTLLEVLTNSTDKNEIYLTYNVDLESAAKQSKLYLKQAQILENSFRSKIKNILKIISKENKSNSSVIKEKSQLLVLLSQAKVWKKHDKYQKQSDDLYSELLLIINSKEKLLLSDFVDALYAIANYCQLNEDKSKLDYFFYKAENIFYQKMSEDKRALNKISHKQEILMKINIMIELFISFNTENLIFWKELKNLMSKKIIEETKITVQLIDKSFNSEELRKNWQDCFNNQLWLFYH